MTDDQGSSSYIKAASDAPRPAKGFKAAKAFGSYRLELREVIWGRGHPAVTLTVPTPAPVGGGHAAVYLDNDAVLWLRDQLNAVGRRIEAEHGGVSRETR